MTDEEKFARELIARCEYIIDPTASARERTHRRSHLTNHDIHMIIAALEATLNLPAIDAAVAREREKPHRCPSCGVISQLVPDVDAHIAAIRERTGHE